VAEGAERWAAFAARLAVARRRGLAALPEEELSRFAADYRDAAADLARLTTALDGRDDDDAFRLGRLVAEGHNLLYRRGRGRPGAAAHYLTRGLPAAVVGAWRPVAVAALLLFGPMLVSAVSVARAPARAAAVLPEGMLRRAAGSAERARRGTGYIEDPELFRPVMAGGIIANNVQVTFVAFAAGVTAGVGTALALVLNGVSIGGVFGLYASHGTLPLLLAFVAPHGVLELSAIAVAGGAGLLLAAAILLPGARTRRDALAENGAAGGAPGGGGHGDAARGRGAGRVGVADPDVAARGEAGGVTRDGGGPGGVAGPGTRCGTGGGRWGVAAPSPRRGGYAPADAPPATAPPGT
jgi:uncharacterized membrane protein SpoIIM required for sporulation